MNADTLNLANRMIEESEALHYAIRERHDYRHIEAALEEYERSAADMMRNAAAEIKANARINHFALGGACIGALWGPLGALFGAFLMAVFGVLVFGMKRR